MKPRESGSFVTAFTLVSLLSFSMIVSTLPCHAQGTGATGGSGTGTGSGGSAGGGSGGAAGNRGSSSAGNNNSNASVDHNFQMWTPVYLDVALYRPRPKARGYLEVNPRLGDNLNGINQLILRPALGYRFNHHVGIYTGYAWITNYQPNYIQENRVWQQLGIGWVLFKRLQTLNRFRLEERFIQGTHGDCSMRGRYMLRLATPLWKNSRWYAVASDELFINFNTVEDGPVRGIDQNRIYGGLGRQLSTHLRVECGYQQQYVNRQDPTADQANHVLMLQTFIDL